MLTLMIGGKAVAVIDADEEDGRNIVASEDFRQELKRLRTAGNPVWDGQASLDVRPAHESEIADFDDADDVVDEDIGEADVAEMLEDEEDEGDDEDGLAVMFLIPLDNSEDEE
ncbi:hypothetical protein ACFOD4_04780 [Pseudoroseomonas globiformis]|uniref:Uncharacterized protein n=1 Tax=Teichococcus globiformis TaxID=2307229 RepID=A0ABV7FVH0_9PROT